MTGAPLITVATACDVRAVFTTRHGGMSKPPFEHANLATSTGDDRAAVRENRRALCRLLGVVPSRVNMMRQVHGAHVRRVDGPLRPGRFCGGLDGWPVADGMVTDRPGVPLVVLAADCVPVLLWRMTGSAVGVAHAGWKGLMAGAVAAVRTALPGSGPIGAAIGPCIDQYNYEVDQGLAERFTARFGDRAVDGRLVNLRLCARIALEGCGVSADRIQDVARSTAEDDFFSHRKEGPRTGRQAGVVWIG